MRIFRLVKGGFNTRESVLGTYLTKAEADSAKKEYCARFDASAYVQFPYIVVREEEVERTFFM